MSESETTDTIPEDDPVPEQTYETISEMNRRLIRDQHANETVHRAISVLEHTGYVARTLEALEAGVPRFLDLGGTEEAKRG